MVTRIEAITWADHSEHMFPTKGIDQDTWIDAYLSGYRQPRYPMPAVPLKVVHCTQHEGYVGIVYIDDVSDPNDPVIVYGWDNWHKRNI